MNVDMQDFWYSPGYILHMEAELVNIYGQVVIDKDTQNFRRVGEMKAAAIMLLALHKAQGHHFFMQASKDEFPDVWTLYQEYVPGSNIDTHYQTVEVVTYGPYSDGDVGDFILKSKLIKLEKSYDEETIILCYIRKEGTFVDFNEVNKKLKEHKFKPTRVFIIGNMMVNERIFTLTQVWPEVHSEAVDYVDRAKAYPKPLRNKFKKGVPKPIAYGENGPKVPINPYEPFYINEKKVKEKYGK